MAYRGKRKLEEFDPNKSDSNDSDFEIKTTKSPAKQRPRAKQARSSQKNRKRPAKRARREGYGDSEDDIEDESDDISEEDSFHEDSSEEEEPPINPKTGRRQRATAKQTKHYEEVSEDEIEASDSDVPPRQLVRKPPVRSSLVVKLRVPSLFAQHQTEMKPEPRSRRGSRATTRGMTPAEGRGIGTRRSSRQAHDEEQPLVSLTDSGKHTRITRRGTATPEPQPQTRPTHAAKGLKKPPSAIMEASQEDSLTMQSTNVQSTEVGPDIFSQLEDAAGDQDAMVEASDAESPFAPATQIDEEGEHDVIVMSEGENAQQAQQADDDDDEDEGPVVRRPSRSLRVSACLNENDRMAD